MQKCINAKIAHFPAKICAIFRFNVQNRAPRGPNPITAVVLVLFAFLPAETSAFTSAYIIAAW